MEASDSIHRFKHLQEGKRAFWRDSDRAEYPHVGCPHTVNWGNCGLLLWVSL